MVNRNYTINEARQLRVIIRRNQLKSTENIIRYSAFVGDKHNGIFLEFYHDLLDNPERILYLGKRPRQIELFQTMSRTGPTSRMARNKDGSANPLLSILTVHPNIPRSRSIQTMTIFYKLFFYVLNGNAYNESTRNHRLIKIFLEKYVDVINEVYPEAERFAITENPVDSYVVPTLDMAGLWTYYKAPILKPCTSLHSFVR